MNINEKLTTIQKALKASKKEKNDFGGYMYRTIESIFEALKPLLEKEKVSLTLSDDIIQIGDRYYIKATAKLFDRSDALLRRLCRGLGLCSSSSE